MKKILVTGGAGFIGSHIVKKLVEDGNEVVVLDLLVRGNKLDKEIVKSVNLFREDVRDLQAVLKTSRGCDQIYHFAAVLGVDIVAEKPMETMETEAIGMKNVVESALVNRVEKIAYASTSGVYGHSAIEKSVNEEIQLDPRTSYSIAKRFNEIYLAAIHEEIGLESISLRYFNVYGTRQDDRMVIPRFFEQAFTNKPLTVFGSGKQTRDFTWIDDVVHATVMAANQVDGCEIFNVANENECTILDLAKAIVKIAGSKSEIVNIESPVNRSDFEVERRVGNSDKLFKKIGFKPQTDLMEGLSRIYQYILLEREKKGLL